MTDHRSALGIALLAHGRAEMLRASLLAHGAAIDQLEAHGIPVRVVLVDRTASPDAAALLAAVEGAEQLAAHGGQESEAAALTRAVDALGEGVEHVLLGDTAAAPSAGALAALLDAARRDDADLALASAGDPAPYALLHRRARGLLDALDATVPPVLALARALRAQGGRVVEVAGAGQLLRDTATTARGALVAGAEAQVADRDAVEIGYATYFGPRSRIVTWAPLERVRIGAYCSFADEVRLLHPGGPLLDAGTGDPARHLRLRGEHRMASASTFPIGVLVPDEGGYDDQPLDGTLVSRPLSIGSDVWIGAGALVLGAVTIGHGAVIGAGAVVPGDVRPYDVVAGNPAKTMRRRFDDRTCERLLAVKWWEWDPAVVRGNHLRFSEPVAGFLARFDPAGELAV